MKKEQEKTSRVQLIKSLDDLRAVRDRVLPTLQPSGEDKSIRVVVGLATCGVAAGAQPVYDALKQEVEQRGLKNVTVVPTGCIGICQFEPVVEVYTAQAEKTTYVKMTPEKVRYVVQQHLCGGNPVAEYTIGAKQ